MRRGMILILFLLCAGLPFALAEEVGSNDLIERTDAYDGREIVFTGEVIGDIMKSGDHVWLNVSDGNNAIGVWVQRDLAQDVQMAGRYAQHGDTIQVTGIFNRACSEHGGDLDIHAKSISLIQRGYPVTHDVPRWKVWLTVLLSACAATCMISMLIRIDLKLSALHNR